MIFLSFTYLRAIFGLIHILASQSVSRIITFSLVLSFSLLVSESAHNISQSQIAVQLSQSICCAMLSVVSDLTYLIILL